MLQPCAFFSKRLMKVAINGHASFSCSAVSTGSDPELFAKKSASSANLPSKPIRGRVLTVVEQDSLSPFAYPKALRDVHPDNASWAEVMGHMAQRLEWEDLGLHMDVFTDAHVAEEGGDAAFAAAAEQADLFLFIGIQRPETAHGLAAATMGVPTGLALDCCDELQSASRLLYQPTLPLLKEASKLLPWSAANKDAQLIATATELFQRGNPNDLLYMVLVLLNACVTPVASAAETPKDLGVILCMVKNCRKEVVGCVQDPECKAALDCLESCGLNDQVCSYRCIVSHESPLFEKFSLCNLQIHNCLNNHAERPMFPDVQPMSSFRGQALTAEVAEQLFVGWMQPDDKFASNQTLEWSWKVVCGVNPAYDYFPCQHQIFYHLKGGKSFWYDPVFQVTTMAGEVVWRRRHYRVKQLETPGSFTFSVLDNGVTSLEYWRIVDVAEDFSWGVFYYSGAASAAGQKYSGAVFCTPDGEWPSKEHWPRVTEVLATCGIKLWELYQVDNSSCVGAPLGLLDG